MIRPSSIERALKCKDSYQLPQFTNLSSPAASEGTRLHDKAHRDYLSGIYDSEYLKYIKPRDGDLNGIEWQGEAYGIAGTCDYWRYNLESRELEVIDLKTGQYPIEPYSPQLQAYALIIIKQLETFGHVVKSIKLTIFQFDESASIDIEREVIEALPDMLNEAPQRQEGRHCMWCLSDCPIRKKYVTDTIEQKHDYNLLNKRGVVKRYLEQLQATLIANHPECVIWKTRMGKKIFGGVK